MNDYRIEVDKQTGEMRRVSLGQKQQSSEPEPIDLAKIESLDRVGLIDLIKRIGNARWADTITMTRQDQAVAMRDRLAHIALTADIKEALVAIDKFLDREEGKPTQTMKVDTVATVSVIDRRAIAMAEANDMMLALAKRMTIEHEPV